MLEGTHTVKSLLQGQTYSSCAIAISLPIKNLTTVMNHARSLLVAPREAGLRLHGEARVFVM